jgi:quercetin dioxygenase-like cupin family protein
MNMKDYLAAAAWLLLLMQNAVFAGDVSSKILTQGSTSWDGGAIEYPLDKPEITVQKITIDTDGKELTLSIHCHTIPLAAYVLKGSLKVIKATGEEKSFHAGDAFIEVMKSWHKGVFTEDAELLVFYAGKSGMPLSIKQDSDTELSKSCN